MPVADRGELDQAALIAYVYLPQFWHTLTSFYSYTDQVYRFFLRICFKIRDLTALVSQYLRILWYIVLLNFNLFLCNILIWTKIKPDQTQAHY